MNQKTHKIIECTVGKQSEQSKIVFSNIQELMDARNEIDNGKDLYLEDKEGLITFLKNKDISYQLYEGVIVFQAKTNKTEE